MSYKPAIEKAWVDLLNAGLADNTLVRFFDERYVIDIKQKQILTPPLDRPASSSLSVLILHYLMRKASGLPAVTGKWIGFRELSNVGKFAFGFKKRALDVILERYGSDPEQILSATTGTRLVEGVGRADVAVTLEAFEGVPILIQLWRADDEFGPEANMLFDANIKDIFCIEDIFVLAEMIAGAIQ